MKKSINRLRTILTVWSMLTLVVGQAGLAVIPVATLGFGLKAQAQEEVQAQTPAPKVVICHATGSVTNPYNRLVVSDKAEGGHFDENGTPLAGHENDILYLDEEAQCPGPVTFSAEGVKWNDMNGNGQREEGEPGLQGVTITLTENQPEETTVQGGLISRTTLTDADGHYMFDEIPVGSYNLCEEVPAGWHQTYPLNDNNNCYHLNFFPATDSAVGIAPSYDFGNQQDEQPNLCGNGVKDKGEQCDDSNKVNGDGCSNECQLETPHCANQESGWWGEYFNLPSNHPDVGSFNIPYFPYDDNVHGDPLGGWAPWTADWYDHQYYRFSRVDSNLNFGDDFFPMDMIHEEQNPAWNNHDFFFAAHWRARVYSPASTTYDYMLRSDDDSWVYIDGVRFDDKDGIHPPATSGITQMPLSQGEHVIDVFYAERHPLGATMVLTLDDRLHPVPAPENCDRCHNPLDYDYDYSITLSDGVNFTNYYLSSDIRADLNGNNKVDYGDYVCSHDQLALAEYQCPIQCAAMCGDGIVQEDRQEQCDDGNINNGDGCNSRCQIEHPNEGPVCGNNVVEEGEQCDEGESNGLPNHCNNECSGITAPVCGNEIIEAGEQCDDGNENNNDSCSNQCTINEVPPVNPPGGGGGGGGFLSRANLAIVKTASTSVVEPGTQVTFTIKVTNVGNIIATNVTLDDTLPAGFTFADGGGTTKTWTWDTIGVGQTVTVSYVVNVASTVAVGAYQNVAVVKSPTGPVSAQGFSVVAVEKPQVQGVSTVAPAAPEKVKVLGFEKLPDTSGDWNYLIVAGAVLVLVTSIVVGRKVWQK